MSIKLALLKSGELLICDAKELVSDEKVVSYLFTKPHKIRTNTPVLLSEDLERDISDKTVEITLSPWILLTLEEDIPVPTDWVVTMVEPVKDLKKMYEEKVGNNAN